MYAISDDNLPVVAAHVALSVRVVLISISPLKSDIRYVTVSTHRLQQNQTPLAQQPPPGAGPLLIFNALACIVFHEAPSFLFFSYHSSARRRRLRII
jgi:hypothetical protein